jgi:hypothetical protein
MVSAGMGVTLIPEMVGFSIKRTSPWEIMMGIADLAINGSYLAYLYVVLLQSLSPAS